MSLWLTPAEIVDLTGKKRRGDQVAVLAEFRPKVVFRVRPEDGFPLVDRAQFIEPYQGGRGRKIERPDFEALGG